MFRTFVGSNFHSFVDVQMATVHGVLPLSMHGERIA